MVFREWFLKTGWKRVVMGFVINLWIFFWLIGSEVIVSQHHQLSGSCQSGGLYACERRTVNFFQLVEVSVLQNSSKEEALDFTCSLRGETKGPWLCLMAKLLLLCLAWVFFFRHFLPSLIKFILWNLGKTYETKI